MPATINDVPISLRPLWVIDQRLTYHAAESGRLLYGLKIDREGKVESEGVDDLPYCAWFGVTDEESFTAGAGTPIKQERKLLFMVSAKREYGMFRRDPTDATAGLGAMEWVDLVRDAIETVTDGTNTSDPYLEGSQSRPILMAVRETNVSELSFSFMLEVTLTIDSVCRGSRSLVDDIDP